MSILSIESDPKTIKGSSLGWLTGVIYLLPHKSHGLGPNLCFGSSPACRDGCLVYSGRGMTLSVWDARMARTREFIQHKDRYMATLLNEIARHVGTAKRRGMYPAIRLNGTSDIAYERIKVQGKTVFEHFPAVQFYDYTKIVKRMEAWMAGDLPRNYDLTFSRSEGNEATCLSLLARGARISACFDPKPLTYHGFQVVDGDEHDLTFFQPHGVWLGLRPKGRMRKDTTGFVVRHK